MAQRYKERLLAGTGVSSKAYESELGLKLLQKMGWNQGNGLGKNQHGRTDCIQVKRREEGAGLGQEDESEKNKFKWNNNWWDHSYNNAAGKVNISNISNNINNLTETETESESEALPPIKSKLNKQALSKISSNNEDNAPIARRTRKYSLLSCSSAGSMETELLQKQIQKQKKKKIITKRGRSPAKKGVKAAKTATKKKTKSKAK